MRTDPLCDNSWEVHISIRDVVKVNSSLNEDSVLEVTVEESQRLMADEELRRTDEPHRFEVHPNSIRRTIYFKGRPDTSAIYIYCSTLSCVLCSHSCGWTLPLKSHWLVLLGWWRFTVDQKLIRSALYLHRTTTSNWGPFQRDTKNIHLIN